MNDLVEWLTACIREDHKAAALFVDPGRPEVWRLATGFVAGRAAVLDPEGDEICATDEGAGKHIALQDPARTIRDVVRNR